LKAHGGIVVRELFYCFSHIKRLNSIGHRLIRNEKIITISNMEKAFTS
jgi:hypothetical protein